MTCPTCHEPLPAGALYGPCEACRVAMRAGAEERAAWRVFVLAVTVRPKPELAPRPDPRPAPAPASTAVPVGHCEFCTKPVYGDQADRGRPAHECCAFWMGELGFDRCFACSPISGRIPAEPTRTPAQTLAPGAAA